MAKCVFQEEAENARRDRADNEEPAELCVVVIWCDAAIAQAAAHPPEDPHPVMEEEAKQHDGRGEVRRDEEGDEVLVVLVDVPAEEAWEDDTVPEARDREQLGDTLKKPQDYRLEVADRRRGDHDAGRVSLSPPV